MKRVFIVEDDPSILDAAKMILEREGYEVTLFTHGEPLLEPLDTVPDLIILDKQLSGVDGIDVARHLKTQESTSHVPLIMVSANPNISTLAKNAGAEEFLEKPFDVKRFRTMVRNLIAGGER